MFFTHAGSPLTNVNQFDSRSGAGDDDLDSRRDRRPIVAVLSQIANDPFFDVDATVTYLFHKNTKNLRLAKHRRRPEDTLCFCRNSVQALGAVCRSCREKHR
jgi:hypothetical protein